MAAIDTSAPAIIEPKLAQHSFFSPRRSRPPACRATWHTFAKGLPQLKFVISLPPSAWFGRRGAPGIDSAESCRNNCAVGVVRRASEVCRGCFFVFAHSVKEADF